jgi:hypothetical protein
MLRFSYLLTVHVTDYHWDRHSYFVIHSYHAQTMTHTPPSDDSILILRLVVLVACDVTCRWHVRLDVSWVRAVANSTKVTILCSDPEPLLA